MPGGTLLGIRTSVWARRTMPDPRNPRTLPSRRHPFAIDPGTGGEDSKFRPVPEPHSLDPAERHKAELVVDIESRHHLTWAAQQAARFETSGGFDYTGADCQVWMREAGFSETRVEPLVGPDSMVIGLK